ncbi:hypothetical protein [Mucilaginibacter sp.]
MAQFITRVELHGANHNETPYQILHQAMASNGFKRTITSDGNITYNLLTAEYEITGNYLISAVIESAKEAALKTGYSYSVFVSEITRASWWNLKQV